MVPPSLAVGAAPTVAACTQFGYIYICPPKNGGLLRPLQAAAAGADRCGLPSPSGLSAQIVNSPVRGLRCKHNWDFGGTG